MIDGDRREIVIAALASEVLNTFDCFRAVLGRLDDDLQTASDLLRIVGAHHQLRAAKDASERVVKVVCDAGRQLTQRGQLFHCENCSRMHLLLGDVAIKLFDVALGLFGLRGCRFDFALRRRLCRHHLYVLQSMCGR